MKNVLLFSYRFKEIKIALLSVLILFSLTIFAQQRSGISEHTASYIFISLQITTECDLLVYKSVLGEFARTVSNKDLALGLSRIVGGQTSSLTYNGVTYRYPMPNNYLTYYDNKRKEYCNKNTNSSSQNTQSQTNSNMSSGSNNYSSTSNSNTKTDYSGARAAGAKAGEALGNLIFGPKTKPTYDNSNSTDNYNSDADKEYVEEQRRAEEERNREEEFQRQMQANQKKKEEFQQMQAEMAGLFKSTTPQQDNSSFKSLNTNTNNNSSSQFKSLNSQTDRPQVDINGKPFLSPAQKESELKKSKIAYDLAVERINNYEKNKTKLEEEIKDLTAKIEPTNKLILEFQKDSAKLEYQETVVWYESTNHGSEMEKAVVTKRENNLKKIYGLSDEEIKQLRDIAIADLKKGAPTLATVRAMKEEGDPVDERLAILTYTAAGFMEGAFSNAKHERAKTIKELKVNVRSYIGSINVKKQQITDMTIEYNNLKRVFDKYGYEIINDTDEFRIIEFGNECRNALNTRIE